MGILGRGTKVGTEDQQAVQWAGAYEARGGGRQEGQTAMGGHGEVLSQSTGDFPSYWVVLSERCWNLAYIWRSLLRVLCGNSSRGGGKETSEEKVPKPGWGELLRLCLAHESRETRARGPDMGGVGWSQTLCVSNNLPEAKATGPGTKSGAAAA